MLASLGVESTEIARIMSRVSSRQIRNVLPRGGISTPELLDGVAKEIVAAKKSTLP
jgi:hypothetical protein